MRAEDFDYVLPPELIAQRPMEPRDSSRLLVLNRGNGAIEHRQFRDLPEFMSAGDVMVLNNSKVIPARLYGAKERTGAKAEIFLVEEAGTNEWWALLRPGKRLAIGATVRLLDRSGMATEVRAKVLDKNAEGHGRIQFAGVNDIREVLDELGHVPLPPYIERTQFEGDANDRQRYQTIFARTPGSVAAPTAGLHFTAEILESVRSRGAVTEHVTLHVGLGTFAPVNTGNLEEHPMHEEQFEIGARAVAAVRAARERGGRVLAVGTTTVRVLESVAAANGGAVMPSRGRTKIFIYPPFEFRVVDRLLTNFHLPRSTLLMLACAFAAPGEERGREMVLSAYEEAIRERYRFYSYGDAMLII